MCGNVLCCPPLWVCVHWFGGRCCGASPYPSITHVLCRASNGHVTWLDSVSFVLAHNTLPHTHLHLHAHPQTCCRTLSTGTALVVRAGVVHPAVTAHRAAPIAPKQARRSHVCTITMHKINRPQHTTEHQTLVSQWSQQVSPYSALRSGSQHSVYTVWHSHCLKRYTVRAASLLPHHTHTLAHTHTHTLSRRNYDVTASSSAQQTNCHIATCVDGYEQVDARQGWQFTLISYGTTYGTHQPGLYHPRTC